MYICENCKRTFADPDTTYDDIGYKYSVCPYCEDDRISSSTPCKQCSDLKVSNGDDYCDSCVEGAIKAVRDALEELMEAERWDRAILFNAMEMILQEE